MENPYNKPVPSVSLDENASILERYFRSHDIPKTVNPHDAVRADYGAYPGPDQKSGDMRVP